MSIINGKMTSQQEESESDFINGTVEKKGYRKRWVSKVKKISNHPFNHGIHMDTHHLISAEAVKISSLGPLLEKKGYDINALNNLVGFPATLPGACQLHCQLHRGDHICSEEPYHKYVSARISKLKKKINSCYGKTEKRETTHEIHSNIMDPISVKILKKINEFKLPLTDIYKNFQKKGVGCVMCDSIVSARTANKSCSTRKHYKSLSANRSGVDYRYPNKKDNFIRGNKKEITFVQENWEPKVGQ
ncbi:AHH domain-containing protein [Aliivibrio fischeri]|uniref:AHH domain-containing protein n=1 Tax=Aliivibrio fischeri TaxID=668 RepID=UPI0012DA6DE1|nr:AHH domain-containing protein [Aliivibrio fischeri]MUJ23857.1 hypothetical protein [Aliivibrio fischeri]